MVAIADLVCSFSRDPITRRDAPVIASSTTTATRYTKHQPTPLDISAVRRLSLSSNPRSHSIYTQSSTYPSPSPDRSTNGQPWPLAPPLHALPPPLPPPPSSSSSSTLAKTTVVVATQPLDSSHAHYSSALQQHQHHRNTYPHGHEMPPHPHYATRIYSYSEPHQHRPMALSPALSPTAHQSRQSFGSDGPHHKMRRTSLPIDMPHYPHSHYEYYPSAATAAEPDPKPRSHQSRSRSRGTSSSTGSAASAAYPLSPGGSAASSGSASPSSPLMTSPPSYPDSSSSSSDSDDSPYSQTPFPEIIALATLQHLHTGKVSCPSCPKDFSRLCNFRSHYRIHQLARPFVCPNCRQQFLRKHDLNRHERIHEGTKPFLCQRCGKGFVRKDALRRHENMIPEIQKFRCVVKSHS